MSRDENLFKRGEVWWFRAVVGGVERRESLRTSDVKAARRLRDEALTRIAAEKRGEPIILFGHVVDAWADHIADQISPTTILRYMVSLGQCRPFLENLNVKAVDGAVITKLVASRRAGGATPATIRRDLTAISSVLKFAEGQEWCDGNPTLSKRRLLKERRDPIALPERTDVDFLIGCCSIRFGALVKAALLTGCRQAELVNATWKAYNRKAKTLEVIGKGNKRRTIELSDEASAQIQAQPVTLKSELIFCRDGGARFAEAASDFVHFRRAAIAKAKRDGREFRRFRFHDLRHLHAVEALRGGKGIYDLQQHLGHTSVKTTEIYLDFLTPSERERAKSAPASGSAQTTAQSRRSGDRKSKVSD